MSQSRSSAAVGAASGRWVAVLGCLMLVFAGLAQTAFAAGQGQAPQSSRGFRILYQQALQSLRAEADGRALQFDAFGRRFDLRLERNERIRFATPARLPGAPSPSRAARNKLDERHVRRRQCQNRLRGGCAQAPEAISRPTLVPSKTT